jgi:hypothetical protein
LAQELSRVDPAELCLLIERLLTTRPICCECLTVALEGCLGGLAQLGYVERTPDIVLKCLGHRDDRIRNAALRAVRGIADQTAYEIVIDLIRSPSTRVAAVMALATTCRDDVSVPLEIVKNVLGKVIETADLTEKEMLDPFVIAVVEMAGDIGSDQFFEYVCNIDAPDEFRDIAMLAVYAEDQCEKNEFIKTNRFSYLLDCGGWDEGPPDKNMAFDLPVFRRKIVTLAPTVEKLRYEYGLWVERRRSWAESPEMLPEREDGSRITAEELEPIEEAFLCLYALYLKGAPLNSEEWELLERSGVKVVR